MGVYHEMKAVKELQEIDINQLQNFLNIIKSLRDLQEAESFSAEQEVKRSDEEYNAVGTNFGIPEQANQQI